MTGPTTGRPRWKTARCGLFAVLLLAAGGGPAAAGEEGFSTDFLGGRIVGDDKSRFEIGFGAFNVISNDGRDEGVANDDTHTEVRLEFRHGRKWYGVGPKVGILVNEEDGIFGYAALYADWRSGNWVISPSAGLGGYDKGDGKDLGGVFQFILSLDAAYEFQSGNRLGVKLSHISNAGIHEDNPGEESLLVTYSIPLEFD